MLGIEYGAVDGNDTLLMYEEATWPGYAEGI